jgi:hypothetical protein
MNTINLALTVDELGLLATLASDQLFRREFIDPRMPGYKARLGEVEFGKALVARLRLLIHQGRLNVVSASTEGPGACGK